MPIVSSFNYADEAEFLDQLILPTLERLGFSLIARYHGAREFGKDVVFAELDRFGHVRYHALQAKYIPSIGLSDARRLIDDCKQAFENPFTHPATGQVERISCFYAANGGSISDQARETFFNAINLPFGGSVGLLDGNAILALDRWAVFNRQELIGERLTAILIELRYNRRLLKVIEERFTRYIEDNEKTFPAGFRLRINACSSYLQVPFLQSSEFDEAVEAYWHNATVVNNALMSIGMGVHLDQRRKDLMKSTFPWQHDLEKSASTMEHEVMTVLRSLGFDRVIHSAIEPETTA